MPRPAMVVRKRAIEVGSGIGVPLKVVMSDAWADVWPSLVVEGTSDSGLSRMPKVLVYGPVRKFEFETGSNVATTSDWFLPVTVPLSTPETWIGVSFGSGTAPLTVFA